MLKIVHLLIAVHFCDISVEHLNIDLLTCTDGEQQNQYHRLNPSELLFAFLFFFGARLCVCVEGGLFGLYAMAFRQPC